METKFNEVSEIIESNGINAIFTPWNSKKQNNDSFKPGELSVVLGASIAR